jgi:hypothetical protein
MTESDEMYAQICIDLARGFREGGDRQRAHAAIGLLYAEVGRELGHPAPTEVSSERAERDVRIEAAARKLRECHVSLDTWIGDNEDAWDEVKRAEVAASAALDLALALPIAPPREMSEAERMGVDLGGDPSLTVHERHPLLFAVYIEAQAAMLDAVAYYAGPGIARAVKYDGDRGRPDQGAMMFGALMERLPARLAQMGVAWPALSTPPRSPVAETGEASECEDPERRARIGVCGDVTGGDGLCRSCRSYVAKGGV